MRLRSVYLQILISSDGWSVSEKLVTPGWRRAKNHHPCPRGSCTRFRYKVYEMNLKHSCYPGDRDEGVDREALLQDRCDREGFGQKGHGGGRKVKWPNSFFDFISILLAHICYIVKCPKKPSWQKVQLINGMQCNDDTSGSSWSQSWTLWNKFWRSRRWALPIHTNKHRPQHYLNPDRNLTLSE